MSQLISVECRNFCCYMSKKKKKKKTPFEGIIALSGLGVWIPWQWSRLKNWIGRGRILNDITYRERCKGEDLRFTPVAILNTTQEESFHTTTLLEKSSSWFKVWWNSKRHRMCHFTSCSETGHKRRGGGGRDFGWQGVKCHGLCKCSLNLLDKRNWMMILSATLPILCTQLGFTITAMKTKHS